MVSCDVTGGITAHFHPLLTPELTKYSFGISKVYVTGMRFQIKLTKISATKAWSHQEVNVQIDKDLNP